MAALSIELALACPGDAGPLAMLSRDLIETGLGWEYRPQRMTALIGNPEAVTLIAREASRTVGFGVMSFGDERAHLVLLAVLPSHQRAGVGRRIMTWLLQTAAIGGIASVHVELRADNATAHAFYCSQGFVQTLYIPGYYRGREAAVRMLRVLRPPSCVPHMWQPPARGSR
jgi:ribosomal-protein-alanine N-acetyltransferase